MIASVIAAALALLLGAAPVQPAADDEYRIVVPLVQRELLLYRGDDLVYRFPVAIGAPDTPTPRGVFVITELVAPPDPTGAYGPYAFGTSARSEVLSSFAGGEPIIGVHGTDRPDWVGHAVSNGCIRLRNEDILKLVELVPLNTTIEFK